MNLIRNTLLVVLIFQLLGLMYMKFFHIKSHPTEENVTINQRNLDKTIAHKKLRLPISTEYTDNQKVASSIKVLKEPLAENLPLKVVTKPTSKPIVKIYKKLKPKVRLSTKIEKYAKKMLGRKYVWGATGPKCYDCSGFTQKVYRKVAGVKLPRVSYLQAKVGKRIPFNRLKQGDMVFFDTEKKRTGMVNHVGIYLSNGNFIHASSGGKKVIITNFNKKRFYKNRFLWGRRVIKDESAIAMQSIAKANTI